MSFLFSMRRRISACILSAMAITICSADDGSDSCTVVRPVTSAYTIGIGGASMCDTYLSPLTYRGENVLLGYERLQAMRFDPERFVMQLTADVRFSRGINESHTFYMYGFDAKIGWGMMRRYVLPIDGLTLAVGGATEASAGMLAKNRAGNNPIAAKAAWTVNLTGYAAWNTRIGRLPVTLRYQPQLPLLGIFFSPQYDELYYEIYLGNRSDIVKFANPASRFAMENTVTADFRFGATALRVGYKGTILSSKANNLVTNYYTNSFIIGISGEWMSIGPDKRISQDTYRIISALY